MAPPPRLSHKWQYRLDAVESAGEVDGNDPVPILGPHVRDHPPHRGAGAIEENIDPASRLGDLCGGGGERAAVGDIDRMRRGVAAAAGDLAGDALGRCRIAVEDRDTRPLRGKRAAGGSADAIPAAGHDSDFPGKILGHAVSPYGGLSATAIYRR